MQPSKEVETPTERRVMPKKYCFMLSPNDFMANIDQIIRLFPFWTSSQQRTDNEELKKTESLCFVWSISQKKKEWGVNSQHANTKCIQVKV